MQMSDILFQRPVPRTAAPEGQWLHDKAPTAPAKARNVPARTLVPPSAPAAATNNNALLVSNLHYEITPKDLIVRLDSFYLFQPWLFILFAFLLSLQSIFGQIGTLIREPLLRVRRTIEFHLLERIKTNFATALSLSYVPFLVPSTRLA
jgi:THO complex subunit 4